MTLEEIKKRIEEIKKESDEGDDSEAHFLEDMLRQEFIESIAQGNSEYSELAKEVVKSEDFEFRRWFE